MFFFFNYTAPTEIYTYGPTLSLHDALPICVRIRPGANRCGARWWRDINLLTAIAVNGTRSTFLEVNLTRLSAARPAHRPCRRPEEARLSTPGPVLFESAIPREHDDRFESAERKFQQ